MHNRYHFLKFVKARWQKENNTPGITRQVNRMTLYEEFFNTTSCASGKANLYNDQTKTNLKKAMIGKMNQTAGIIIF
jgi:hypothetical protein